MNVATHELLYTIDLLRAELAEVKAGYQALDKNWETMHEAAMGPIRSALDLPNGSVLEIVTESKRPRHIVMMNSGDAGLHSNGPTVTGVSVG